MLLLLLVFSLLCAFSLFLFNRLLVFRVDCGRFYLVIVVVFFVAVTSIDWRALLFFASFSDTIQFDDRNNKTQQWNVPNDWVYVCMCLLLLFFFLYLQRLRLNVLRLLRSKKFPRVYDSFLMHVFNSVFLLLLLPFRCVCVYMYHHVFQPLTNNTVFFSAFFLQYTPYHPNWYFLFRSVEVKRTKKYLIFYAKHKKFYRLCYKIEKCYEIKFLRN